MYSLIALFAIIPLIFSHFFAGLLGAHVFSGLLGEDFLVRLGESLIIDNGIGHFESVKMPIFLILTLIATFEMSFRKAFFTKKTLIVGISLVIFGLIGYAIFPHENIQNLLFGIGEKQHGILLPIALIWIGYLISLISKKEQSTFSTVILCSGGIIALISIVEGIFGYNIFTGAPFQTTGSWGDIRATATLGNPNYVAGYLLMLIPLALTHIKRGEKYILSVLLFVGILMTKSVIGVSLAVAFLVFLIGVHFLGKRVYIVFPILVLILFSLVFYRYGDTEKWLSLSSRFVLMKETASLSTENPLHTLFGYGPNGVIEMYAGVRSQEIDAYFPPESTIDSSHNVFLDIAVKYGLLGLSLLIGFLVIRWRELETYAKYGLVLGFLFFSLNVIVLSHLIVMVFFLVVKKLQA